MRIGYIEKFLGHYTDQKLAELLAHCEDGKFAFFSCCCFIGAATADHPLVSKADYNHFVQPWSRVPHYRKAKQLAFADGAESEVRLLAPHDDGRRALLIPIIKEEMERRAKLRESTLNKTLEMSEISV